MTEIRKADLAARRQALLLGIFGTAIGALLIAGWERYRLPFRDWLASGPGELAQRVRLVLLLVAAGVSAPLLALATYLWRLGARALRTRQFPPPGYRVIRDTPIIEGPAAMFRGRVFRALALCLAMASVLMWLLLWRLARLLAGTAA